MRWRCIVFLAVLLFAAVFPVYALTLKTVTITWEEFNAAYNETAGLFPKCKPGYGQNLTDWTVTITHDLVWNASYTAGIAVSSLNYSGQVTGKDAVRVFFLGTNFRVTYANATGSWVTVPSPTTFYTFTESVKLVYANKSLQIWGDGSSKANVTLYQHVTPAYILYKVTRQNLLLSGSMQITISRDFQMPVSNILDVVVQLLPAVLIVAFLGVAMALMKSTMKG